MKIHRYKTVVLMLWTLLGFTATPHASNAADEALASRDTISSNLEDIVDRPSSATGLRPAGGSSNPLVLVDDAVTEFRLSRRTHGAIAVETCIRVSDEVPTMLTVGSIAPGATAASMTFQAEPAFSALPVAASL